MASSATLLMPAEFVPPSSTEMPGPAEPEKQAAIAAKVTIAKTENTATAVSECEKTDVLCEIAGISCKAMLPQSDVKCWNCDHLMEPDHQCEESSSSSSNNVSNMNETLITVT